MAEPLPTDLRWDCKVCGAKVDGTDEALAHLASHGHEVQRWPDGAPVVDMSEVPELLAEEPDRG